MLLPRAGRNCGANAGVRRGRTGKPDDESFEIHSSSPPHAGITLPPFSPCRIYNENRKIFAGA